MRSAAAWVQALLISALTVAAFAPAYADDPDPPTRVARVSYLKGDVDIQPAQANDWVQARINRPLTNNDQVWTNGGARAELQVGNSAVQLDENTQLSVLELSDNIVQLQLTQGTANIYVRGLDQDESIEIDTPNAAMTVQEPGAYRIHAGDAGDLTVVQIRNGSAEVSGEQQSFSLRENEQVTLRGTTRLAAEFDDLGRMDDFDRWAAARNSRATHVVAAQYVSSDVIGYEDLDAYGYWRYEPDYGQVWFPTRVVSGWSPYRYGHWDWIAPWGWTWVDDAPWGFAPFHYGRWARISNDWCWVPGPRAVRAVYAPALVAWVGTPGIGVSVSVTARPVGWIPLGPREVYRPTYRVSPHYVERVNLSNSLLKQDEFERGYRRQPHEDNFSNRGATTVVAANTLRSAQPVERNLVRADVRKWQRIEPAAEVRPDRASVTGGSRTVTPPRQIVTRDVVARRAPTPAVQPGTNVGASRGTVRIVQPVATQRPFVGEQRDQARRSNTSQPTPPLPANDRERVISHPTNDAPANSHDGRFAEPPNAARPGNPEANSNRAADNPNDRPRGERRGFISPHAQTSEQTPERPSYSAPPAVQHPAPMPAPVMPERHQRPPQIENNVPPAPREMRDPTPRNRVSPPTRAEPQRPVAPPAPVIPPAPPQRVQPAPPPPQQREREPREQHGPPQNKPNNDNEQEKRRRHEDDAR